MSVQSDVYWNSHRETFSIKPREPTVLEGFIPSPKGRVFYNTGPFLLEDPTFIVSEAGRQWVLRNRKKTVHASIRGLPRVEPNMCLPKGARRVRYNPYRNSTFVLEDGTPVFKASVAYLINDKVWIA